MSDRTLVEDLARYMDNTAFTAKRIGKERAAKMKDRREIAMKRARASVRFFLKPENRERLDGYRGPLADTPAPGGPGQHEGRSNHDAR